MRKKRIFDLAIALTLSIPAFIICILLSAIIYLELRNSPIFIQMRVGRNNAPFKIFKLRTMKADTVDVASHIVPQAQITRTGAWLRRWKFDELPQLYNVLNGTMSFVGPRPCLPSQNELILERTVRGVSKLLPGITGLGQLAGLDMSTPRELAVADAEYIGTWSLTRDLGILIRTVTGDGRGDAALESRSQSQSTEQGPSKSLDPADATAIERNNFRKSVVISGAAGFLGQAIIPRLIADGWRVIALVRQPNDNFEIDVQQQCFDDLANADPNRLAEVMRGADCLIHLAAVVPGKSASSKSRSAKIAEVVCEAAVKAGTPKIIVLSSVYAALAERGDPNARAYGHEKLAADRSFDLARSSMVQTVTLRPPVVYGSGMSGTMSILAKMVRAGLPLPFGLARNERYYISKSNLVDLIATIAIAPEANWKVASDQYYVPTDGLPLSTAMLIKTIAKAYGQAPILIPVPLPLLRFIGKLLGKAEMLSAAIDPLLHNENAALLKDFGWVPVEQVPASIENWIKLQY